MIIIHTIGNIKNEPRTLQFKSFFESNEHATLVIEYQYKTHKRIQQIMYLSLFLLKILKKRFLKKYQYWTQSQLLMKEKILNLLIKI
jgi:hypothetical protein